MVEDRGVSQPVPKADTKGDLYYFDLRSVVAFVSGNLTSIALGAAAGAALGLGYLLLTNPSHTAQAQLLIDPGLTRVLREQALEQPMAMDSQQVETEIAILRSEDISQSVVTALGLVNEPEFAVTLMSDYLPDSLVSASMRASADAERAKLVLTISREPDHPADQRLVCDRRPVSRQGSRTAARIANESPTPTSSFQIDTRTTTAEVRSKWLKGRIGGTRRNTEQGHPKIPGAPRHQSYSISKTSRCAAPDKAASASPRSTLEEFNRLPRPTRHVYDSFMQTYVATVQQQSFPLSNAKRSRRPRINGAKPVDRARPGDVDADRTVSQRPRLRSGHDILRWLDDGISRFVSAERHSTFSRS